MRIKEHINRQTIAYLLSGALTTFIDWGLWLVIRLFYEKSGIDIVATPFPYVTIGNTISWAVSVVFAFITNKIFVFESRSWKVGVVTKEFVSFVLARLITYLINIVGISLITSFIRIDNIDLMAKGIIAVIVVILNYVFSKCFVFQKKDSNRA